MIPFLPIAALILGGGYLLKRRADSTSSAGASAPVFTPGPGGSGRIYGSPTVDIPAVVWTSGMALLGPACAWVVEGDNFLPANAVAGPAKSTLADALTGRAGSAWSYVAYLVDTHHLSATQAADTLMQDAANLWPVDPAAGSPCAPGSPRVGTPLASWRDDVAARITVWLGQRSRTSTTSATFVPPPTRRASYGGTRG